MNRIQTILFDLGNVLAYIDFDAFWRSLGCFNQEEKSPYIDGYTQWTKRYETGLIPTNEYLSELNSVFSSKFTKTQLEAAFANIMLEPIERMYDLVEKISQTYKTALVSNTNDIHYSLSIQKYKALSLLPKHYLSYKIQVMKPDKKFYDAIIKDQNVDPSQLLFIDDLQINIDGAKYVGMNAIKYENVNQLEVEFKKFGIVVEM